DVTHVVLLEPSRIVATAQTALYMLARKLNEGTQFSIFDKNSDGLVDALSHILKTSIIEVNATKSGASSSQFVMWDADARNMHHKLFPGVARYLGVGSKVRSEEHTSELQSRFDLVCRLLLEKKNRESRTY